MFIEKARAEITLHDFLTNLLNRILLNDRIAQKIVLAARRGTQLTALFLDLDNFKHIYDSRGHTTGDKLLQSVAFRVIASMIRREVRIQRHSVFSPL